MTLADVEFSVQGTLNEREDILRCLWCLLMTPAGTVPLDRDFGINGAALDYPMSVAQNVLAVEIIDKVARYEPRVKVKEVQLETNNNGELKAKVVITGGGYTAVRV